MISLLLLGLVIGIAVYRAYQYMNYKPTNFPPGPPRIPIFGSYLFMLLLDRHHLQRAANFFAKWYKSNIIGLYLGTTPTIILNDTEKVKKALFVREFDGKPDLLIGRLRDPNFNLRGIFFTDGPLWHEQRRFALRYLRDYGFGRRFQTLEINIQDELLSFIDLLKYGPKYPHEKKYVKDSCINLPIAFSPFFANCFIEILFNERFPRSELHELYNISLQAFRFQRSGDDYGKLFSVWEPIAKLFPDASDYKAIKEASTKLHDFFRKLIDKQIKSYDPAHERNFIDMYMTQMRETNAMSDTKSTFTYDQLVLTCLDFSFPPLSALSATVTFLIQQIFKQPVIQTNIQNEIDSVVGSGRLPTLDDRINLPYTEASIREIMRYETLVPSGLPHKALEDTTFMGYDIPKGTVIVTALEAASHDKDTWNHPENFSPERFIGDDGKLCLQKDFSLPFGAGKRLCAGETFARNMLFLLVSGFFQNFSIATSDSGNIPDFNQNSSGVIKTTPDFWVKILPR